MSRRPAYTDAQVRAFLATTRGGRDRRADVLEAMRHHPAGKARPSPHTTPSLTNADGTPADPLPTTTPEDHQ